MHIIWVPWTPLNSARPPLQRQQLLLGTFLGGDPCSHLHTRLSSIRCGFRTSSLMLPACCDMASPSSVSFSPCKRCTCLPVVLPNEPGDG